LSSCVGQAMRPLAPCIDVMQLATSGRVTGLVYKELSFRSVSKPGRITAPGFVLVRSEDGGLQQLRQQRRFGPNQELRNSVVLAPVIFAGSTCG
jgi:hypothetical protein